MPEVEVGLMPIIGHVALAVLVGVEGAWVNVDIGVKLLDRDAVATCLKELPEGGHDASRHEDILCFHCSLCMSMLSTYPVAAPSVALRLALCHLVPPGGGSYSKYPSSSN